MRLNLGRLLDSLVASTEFVPRLLSVTGHAPPPMHMLLEVTYRCNLRCNFCQYLNIIDGSATTRGPVREHSADDIRRAVDAFPKGRLITFTGGEVMVKRGFLDLLAHASSSHRTHIVTNGTRITPEVAERLVSLAPRWPWQRGLLVVCVSMEGSEAVHDRIVGRPGSWAKTVAGIEHMVLARRAAGTTSPKLNLRLVVTEHTVDEIVDFVRLARSLGVDMVNLLVENEVVEHSASLTGDGTFDLIRTPQQPPAGVDPHHLRDQLIRAYHEVRGTDLRLRTTPSNLPILEFARHYAQDRRLDPRDYRCEGAWSRVQLTGDGRYSPCPFVRAGDSRTETVVDHWNGGSFRRFRRTVRDEGIFEGCEGCCNARYHGPLPQGLAGVPARDVVRALRGEGESSARPTRTAVEVAAVPVGPPTRR